MLATYPGATSSNASPVGNVSSADVPKPSALPYELPAAPPPTSVVTAPLLESTTRILWFAESDTNTSPPLPTAMPAGYLKSAAEPDPSTCPYELPVVPPPASVVTVYTLLESGTATRILWLPARAGKGGGGQQRRNR